MLINIGLEHLGWEILPGRSCLGPWARAHGPMQQQGPGSLGAGPMLLLHGPGPMGSGKISQARSPSQGVQGLY